jgi:hypothetical protein
MTSAPPIPAPPPAARMPAPPPMERTRQMEQPTRAMAWLVVQGMATDMFRIPYVLNPQTWLYSALITMAAALARGIAVRRRLDHFDLISVLKTRE